MIHGEVVPTEDLINTRTWLRGELKVPEFKSWTKRAVRSWKTQVFPRPYSIGHAGEKARHATCSTIGTTSKREGKENENKS